MYIPTPRSAVAIGVLATMIVATTTALTAQSYANVVWQQLSTFYDNVSASGYSTSNYIIGALDDDETETWTLQLQGGRTYAIHGACDGDCEDIDIRVTQAGRAIASDTLVDSYPVVGFAVDRDAAYSIEVEMFRCSVEPCYFGLGIFYR